MADDNTSTGGAIASAAVSALGNYAITAAANKRQYRNQVKAMALQDQYNRDLWDYQNAYNTPTQQMQRLKDAGLNPRLIYGSGAGGGSAGPIESLQVPTEQAPRTEIPDMGNKYLMARQLDSQYAATTQNVENMKKRAALMEVQTGLENLKLMRENLRAKNYGDLAQAEVDTQKFIALRSGELFSNEKGKGALIDQLGDLRKKQISGIELDNTFKTYRNDFAKLGIYSSDHPAMRILIRAADRMGVDLGELMMRGAEKLMYLIK